MRYRYPMKFLCGKFGMAAGGYQLALMHRHPMWACRPAMSGPH